MISDPSVLLKIADGFFFAIKQRNDKDELGQSLAERGVTSRCQKYWKVFNQLELRLAMLSDYYV